MDEPSIPSQQRQDLGADWVRQNGEVIIGGDWLTESGITEPMLNNWKSPPPRCDPIAAAGRGRF